MSILSKDSVVLVQLNDVKREFSDIITKAIQEQLAPLMQSPIYKPEKEPSESELLTLQDVADYFKVSPNTVRSWRKDYRRKMPKPIYQGRRLYFKRKDIVAMTHS